MRIFKLFSVIVLLIMTNTLSLAQDFFMLSSQAPLLVNPGMAGSNKSLRTNILWNTYADKSKLSYNNIYASADMYSKKLNLGWGVYYSSQSKNLGTVPDSVLAIMSSNQLPQSSLLNSKSQAIGLCLSRKFISPNQKYTLSPALGFEYSWITQNQLSGFILNKNKTFAEIQIGNYLGYTTGLSSYNFKNDSTFSAKSFSYLHTLQNVKSYKITPGLVFNSENFMFSYHCSFNTISSNMNLTMKNYIVDKLADTVFVSATNNKTNYSFTHTFFSGYNYKPNELAKYSFTFLGGLGYHWSDVKNVSNTNVYMYNSTSFQQNGLSFIHASLQYKYLNWMIGYALTSQNYFTKHGLSLGYQTPKIRVISNFSILNQNPNIELALQYTLK